jgi:hypothetical protein
MGPGPESQSSLGAAGEHCILVAGPLTHQLHHLLAELATALYSLFMKLYQPRADRTTADLLHQQQADG